MTATSKGGSMTGWRRVRASIYFIVPENADLDVRAALLDHDGEDPEAHSFPDAASAVADWALEAYICGDSSWDDDKERATKAWVITDYSGEDLGPATDDDVAEVQDDDYEWGDGWWAPPPEAKTRAQKDLAMLRARLAEQQEFIEAAAMLVSQLNNLCMLGKRTEENWERVQDIAARLERELPLS